MEFSSKNHLDDKKYDEMKALQIDVLLPQSIVYNVENLEVYFTLIGLVKKAEEMTINLANRSFSYFLIIISNLSPNYINSAYTARDIIDTNLFANIASNRYSSH